MNKKVETKDLVTSTIAFLQSKINTSPDVGIICGSGLGGLAETLQQPITIDYSDIPGFAQSTVKGHSGKLVFGFLGNKNVICMKGRFHYYEGYSPSKIAYPVKIMCALGIKILIVTNAAGGLNREYRVGDLMIIKDHISIPGLSGINSLIGPVDTRFGSRFPACNQYDRKLQQLFKDCVKEKESQISIHEGVYCGLSGPNYETPAEIRFLRVIGGDSVGMSTVFEVQMAAQCGLPVFGLSLITNRCKGPDDNWQDPNHEEVLAAGRAVQNDVQKFVSHFVAKLNLSQYDRTRGYKHFSKY